MDGWMDGWSWLSNKQLLTFKSEYLVPTWIEIFTLDVRRQRMLLVGEQRNLHVWVGRSRQILGGQ